MSINNNSSNDSQIPISNLFNPRKTYCKPLLMELGDLRSLTLGISPNGIQDSSGGLFTEHIKPHFLFPPNSTPTRFP